VRRELRLLITPARHVGMRTHNLAPRLESGSGFTFNRRARSFALFTAALFIEADAEKFHFGLVHFLSLWSRNSSKESRGTIERSVSVIRAERALVRPAVANISQLAHKAALSPAKCARKRPVPLFPHYGKYERYIPLRILFAADQVQLLRRERCFELFEPALG